MWRRPTCLRWVSFEGSPNSRTESAASIVSSLPQIFERGRELLISCRPRTTTVPGVLHCFAHRTVRERFFWSSWSKDYMVFPPIIPRSILSQFVSLSCRVRERADNKIGMSVRQHFVEIEQRARRHGFKIHLSFPLEFPPETENTSSNDESRSEMRLQKCCLIYPVTGQWLRAGTWGSITTPHLCYKPKVGSSLIDMAEQCACVVVDFCGIFRMEFDTNTTHALTVRYEFIPDVLRPLNVVV